jgi:ribosomal protein S27E
MILLVTHGLSTGSVYVGKQDMCNQYARRYADAFVDTTEEQARMAWEKDIHDLLSTLITRLTESTSVIFPLECPKCESLKITVVFGTSRSLECLSCGSRFRIVDKT